MGEVIHSYELLEPLQNKNAGFCRWSCAIKRGRNYFIKEFMDPIWPTEKTISVKYKDQMIQCCHEYETKQMKLYTAINQASDGNVVRISEFFRYNSHYYITTEVIKDAGDGIALMQNRSVEERVLLCRIIAHSIMMLHRAHIIHADLKPDNILIKLTSTGSLTAKVIDFDCSFFEEEAPSKEDELGGDQVYLAPEACMFMCGDRVALTCKMDVFALGILFHQYISGTLPQIDSREYDYIYEAVLDGHRPLISDKIPERLSDVISRMLECEPEARPTIEEVYQMLDSVEAPYKSNDVTYFDVTVSSEDDSFSSDQVKVVIDDPDPDESGSISRTQDSRWFTNAGSL